MNMSLPEAAITIAICALATAATRFLPFLLFPAGRKTPAYVSYLGRVLPYAVIGLLIVYCLRSVDLALPSRWAPEAVSIAIICAVHAWKRNVLLSIALGTALYMILIQVVFA